eukprot:7386937-Prymnesium_polylepis.1
MCPLSELAVAGDARFPSLEGADDARFLIWQAVAHIVMSCPANQEYIRVQGGVEPLLDALTYAIERLHDGTAFGDDGSDGGGGGLHSLPMDGNRPAVDLLKVTETACLALGNVGCRGDSSRGCRRPIARIRPPISL